VQAGVAGDRRCTGMVGAPEPVSAFSEVVAGQIKLMDERDGEGTGGTARSNGGKKGTSRGDDDPCAPRLGQANLAFRQLFFTSQLMPGVFGLSRRPRTSNGTRYCLSAKPHDGAWAEQPGGWSAAVHTRF
jgi:hypothetical protein